MTTVLAEPGDAVLRPHAEQEYQAELAALAADDDRPRPARPGARAPRAAAGPRRRAQPALSS